MAPGSPGPGDQEEIGASDARQYLNEYLPDLTFIDLPTATRLPANEGGTMKWLVCIREVMKDGDTHRSPASG